MSDAAISNTCAANPDEARRQAEIDYWARRGPKIAAFLLVIPGPAVIGAGIGLIAGHLLPATLIGLGAGMLAWGLIVALTD
jgi:hypothetical protein